MKDAREEMMEELMPDAQPLPAGTPAPEFSLGSMPGQTIRLSDFRGRAVILAFYPGDWSPICGDQLAVYSEIVSEFEKRDAQLLAISVDSVWCHQAYAKARQMAFPLLADFEPKGAVARKYGAYRDSDGTAQRALFVIDAGGIIRWSYLSPIDVNPGADGILDALEEMNMPPALGAEDASQISQEAPQ